MRPSAILVAGACALGAASSANGSERQDLRALLLDAPSDIVDLARRAIDCRTWSTAEVVDEASDMLVERALAALRCDALDADIDALRWKHARSASELKAIDAVRNLGP